MNEETTQLLRELSEKLGVTAERLWDVLVAQAPISATVNTAILLALLLAAVASSIKLKRSCTPFFAGKTEGEEITGWAILTIGLLLALSVGVIGTLEMTVAGFLNPEYWALKQLLP